MLHYLTSLNDINIIYLIHMQKEGTVEKGRSTACREVNLVLDLNQKVFLSFYSIVFYMYIYIYICIYICIYMYICMYIYIYIRCLAWGNGGKDSPLPNLREQILCNALDFMLVSMQNNLKNHRNNI